MGLAMSVPQLLIILVIVALIFVYRSFYSMRIPINPRDADVVHLNDAKAEGLGGGLAGAHPPPVLARLAAELGRLRRIEFEALEVAGRAITAIPAIPAIRSRLSSPGT